MLSTHRAGNLGHPGVDGGRVLVHLCAKLDVAGVGGNGTENTAPRPDPLFSGSLHHGLRTVV